MRRARSTPPEQDRLESLLTYGPREEAASPAAGALVLVVPRPGTMSPWSSKATDIARVCGLDAVRRIERGIAWSIESRAEASRSGPRSGSLRCCTIA